jgi:hypothetical protein
VVEQDPGGQRDEWVIDALWLNVNGRKSRESSITMALAMAKRPPFMMAFAETNTDSGDPPAAWEDYQMAARAPAWGRANSGIEVYVEREQACQVTQLWDSGRGDALLTQVLIPKGKAYVLFAHAPHTQKVGVEEYREFWEEVWRAVTKWADPQLTMLIMDANQPAREADRPGRRTEGGLREFYAAHDLLDVTDILDVPEGTFSCVKGTDKSRIDTLALTKHTRVRSIAVAYGRSHAMSDWHTPMMLMAAWPVDEVPRPKAGVNRCAHEQHMKNVDLTREETQSYWEDLAKREQPDPEMWPAEWLNQLQKAMHDWAEKNGHLEWKKVRPDPPQMAERWVEGEEYYNKRGGVKDMLPDEDKLEEEMMALTGVPGQTIDDAKRSLAKMEREAVRQSEAYRVARARKKREYQMELHREAEVWTGVKEATRSWNTVGEMPLEGRVMMSKMEALMQIYNDRMELQGERYRVREDPEAWRIFQKYMALVRAKPVEPIEGYVTVERLQAMPRGRARGRDVYLKNGPVHIDICWYQQIGREDQEKLCRVLETPEVHGKLGKEGRVSLLVKKDHLPAAKGNLRGITIAPHISKLQPSAYYADEGWRHTRGPWGGP